MAGFLGLGGHARYERAGFQLYASAVAAARDPFLYTDLGVPDTLDGRFDLVCLHVFLVIQRLTREAAPGPALAQAVFDAMFSDMDINLREMGVGDLSVGKRVKAMWDAFHGRAAVYSAAMAAGDRDALEVSLVRNLWRGATPSVGAAAALRRLVERQAARLDGQPLAALVNGDLKFLSASEACR